MDFWKFVSESIVIFDGAMGTQFLQKIPDGKFSCFEVLNLLKPDWVKDVHRSYLDAGATVIQTNTFGANIFRLKRCGYENFFYEINRKGAEIAKEIATHYKNRFVAGSIGPSGVKFKSHDSSVKNLMAKSYFEQAVALVEGGADILLLETGMNIEEVKIASESILMARKHFSKKVYFVVQLTFNENGVMPDGTDFETACSELLEIKPDIAGINCSDGVFEVMKPYAFFSKSLPFPVSLQPSAGIPEIKNRRLLYPYSPEVFGTAMKKYAMEYGVNILGGCCGTTPEHIRVLKNKVSNIEPRNFTKKQFHH